MQNKIPFMWTWEGRLVRKGKNFRYLALLHKKLTQQGVAAWITRRDFKFNNWKTRPALQNGAY